MRVRLKKLAIASAIVASGFDANVRGDIVYSSLAGTQTTLYNFKSAEVGGGTDGIGDDYDTGLSGYISIDGFSFYGGLTNSLDHLNLYFYDSAGNEVLSIQPPDAETHSIGLHTLNASDFLQSGSQGISIPASGYVIFAPISYTTYNVNNGVTTAGDPNPPTLSLGFGQAPSTGSNNASISAMTNQSYFYATVSTGAYAATPNQYAQFQITTGLSGVWIHPGSGNWEDAGNWDHSLIASGTGETATFADAIGTGSATVTLTANEVVGNVAFSGTQGGSYTIASNSSNDTTLTLNNGASPAVISVASGNQTISAPIAITNGLSISTANSSSFTLAGAVNGTGVLTTSANSVLLISPTALIGVPLTTVGTTLFSAQASGTAVLARNLPSVNVSSGGVFTVGAAATGIARQLLTIGSVNLAGSTGAWTGKIDLTNNDMIIQAGTSTNVATITKQVAQGFNGGTWNAAGGILSSSAATDSRHITAIGIIQNNQSGQPIFTVSHQFDGVTPGAADVLLKYTYYGDTDLSGKVDGSDYSRIDSAYLTLATGWYNGDFNYDGVINGSDYTLIDNAFNTQGASLASLIAPPRAIETAQIAGSSAVPEPATLALIGTGSLAFLLGRKRTAVHLGNRN